MRLHFQLLCGCALQVNGILEAYVHASASSRQLAHINVGLVAFAAAHMALSVVLVRLGDARGEHNVACHAAQRAASCEDCRDSRARKSQ